MHGEKLRQILLLPLNQVLPEGRQIGILATNRYVTENSRFDIFQRHAHLQMPELRAFVRIDGIDPNWSVSVTPELRDAIIQRAAAFLRGTE